MELSPVLQAIVSEFGKTGTNKGRAELDEVKVLAALHNEPVPALGRAAIPLAFDARRKKKSGMAAEVQAPFNPESGIFRDPHIPGKKADVCNRAWEPDPEAQKKRKKDAKHGPGLRFLLDTVYIGIVRTNSTFGFCVYLWRKTDADGTPLHLTHKESFKLVPFAQVRTMTAMWPDPAPEDKAATLRQYPPPTPSLFSPLCRYVSINPEMRALPADNEYGIKELPVDIRRILQLAQPPQPPRPSAGKKKRVVVQDDEEQQPEEEEDEVLEEEHIEAEQLPIPRAGAGAAATASSPLDVLASKWDGMVRILGRTPRHGVDQHEPPTPMRAEFAGLMAIPARAGLVATMGPSAHWQNSPLLNGNVATRAVHALRSGDVDSIEVRHAVEDAILLRRADTHGTFVAVAVLEHQVQQRGVTIRADANYVADMDALFSHKKTKEALVHSMGAFLHGGREITTLMGDRWPIMSTLSEVCIRGGREDAIIWILIHALRVGPAIARNGSLHRPLILVDETTDELAWIALTTPGTGAGETWCAGIPVSLAPHPTQGQKAAAVPIDSWGSKSEASVRALTLKTLELHMPAWH